MSRRYVRGEADLPEHDLVLEHGNTATELAYHVRHYVHQRAHMVIVGGFDGGPSYILDAASVAKELAELVVPEGREFAMVAYAPQSPLSREPHFREVSFEVGDGSKRPSSAALAGPKVAVPRTRPLDLAAVEAMAGRPVLTFPYGFYTRALAEAMNGQPAKRLFELLIEAGLACPVHGPSPYGEYCGTALACEQERNRRARGWRAPYAPRRRSVDGGYRGTAASRPVQIELAWRGRRRPIPLFGRDALEPAWGYGGSGPAEAATSILADYLGFLPRPELSERFKTEVIAHLPAATFTLPISEVDRWFDDASPASKRGLVVVAGPASVDWPAGQASGMAAWIAQGLLDAGFDVYEPGRNGEAPRSRRTDHRLHGMLHASLLSALDRCSMLVIPYDGEAIMQDVEGVTALQYALEHPHVAAMLAYDRAEADDFVNHETHGVAAVRVGGGMPRDVGAVVSSVDGARAAYECLHVTAGA
jgi:hypothetical protein